MIQKLFVRAYWFAGAQRADFVNGRPRPLRLRSDLQVLHKLPRSLLLWQEHFLFIVALRSVNDWNHWRVQHRNRRRRLCHGRRIIRRRGRQLCALADVDPCRRRRCWRACSPMRHRWLGRRGLGSCRRPQRRVARCLATGCSVVSCIGYVEATRAAAAAGGGGAEGGGGAVDGPGGAVDGPGGEEDGPGGEEDGPGGAGGGGAVEDDSASAELPIKRSYSHLV